MPKEAARFAVAGILVLCSAAIFYFITRGYASLEWKDVTMIVVGVLSTNLTTVVNYYYGSSQGSKDKTDALVKVLENGNEEKPC